jgi:hypothetical protein
MYWDVVEAKVMGSLEFAVTFADGLSGKVKILPTHLYGVFEKLRDPEFFKELRVTDGFVSWPGDIDIAPDAMYREIKSKGTWVLE